MVNGQRRVMVAVDDTEVSSYAFTWGLRNFIRDDDHVVVLTAAPYTGVEYPTADIAAEYAVPIMSSGEGEGESAAISVPSYSKTLISKYLQLLLQSNISCEGEVVKGDAGRWIADEGQRLKADVIIVGSNASGVVKRDPASLHGVMDLHYRLSRTLLGSISDYVLHNAPCTVAIVRQTEEELSIHDPLASSAVPRKIVIAVDESKEAIHAFTWALKNICNAEDRVIIYHVHHPYVPPITGVGIGEFGIEDVYTLPEAAVKDEVASLNESQKVVEKFMEYADHKSPIKCVGMVVTGETQAKVIEGLIALKADAVVVGTHDRSAVSRTFLGSVSDYLAHHSPCPLIVVKGGASCRASEFQS